MTAESACDKSTSDAVAICINSGIDTPEGGLVQSMAELIPMPSTSVVPKGSQCCKHCDPNLFPVFRRQDGWSTVFFEVH